MRTKGKNNSMKIFLLMAAVALSACVSEKQQEAYRVGIGNKGITGNSESSLPDTILVKCGTKE